MTTNKDNITTQYLKALADYQKANKITSVQVSQDTGIEVTALSRIKNGKQALTIDNLKAITRAYPAMFYHAIRLIADPPCETPEELKERILKALEETR